MFIHLYIYMVASANMKAYTHGHVDCFAPHTKPALSGSIAGALFNLAADERQACGALLNSAADERQA